MERELQRLVARWALYASINIIADLYPTGHVVRRALLIDDTDKIYEAFERKLEKDLPMEVKEVA